MEKIINSPFGKVVGQNEAVLKLKRAIAAAHEGNLDSQEMVQTWLIAGPPGSGRSIVALGFAKGLLCPNQGCDKCDACKTVDAATHLDLEYFKRDGLSIKVDEIRELIVRASYQPSSAQFRVVILEDGDRLTESAANALLKAIEEPGLRTVWILCAPTLADVLPTIRSRARALTLKTPSQNEIIEILESEGISKKEAESAAQLSLGHIGRARLLVKNPSILKFRNDLMLRIINLNSIAQSFEIASWLYESIKTQVEEQTNELNEKELTEIKAAWGENGKKLITGGAKVVKELESNQKLRTTRMIRSYIDQSLIDITTLYRDLIDLQFNRNGEDTRIVNSNFKKELQTLASNISSEKALSNIESLNQTRVDLARNAAPQLALESLIIKLI